ncbi:hypothetical protein BC834DRAFT_880220 [Gloeopeniophorella convolvens]|nr:hypothetical protein BC834DRAFT_880220 [Gloeopeniophorella convolvens]
MSDNAAHPPTEAAHAAASHAVAETAGPLGNINYDSLDTLLASHQSPPPPGVEEITQEQSGEQALESHEILELQAFSERKEWIVEKIKLLESMPPIELFAGLDAVRSSAPVTSGLPTREELQKWLVEHDKIEKETEAFDSGELKKLKTFTKAASKRNLSPQDTDIIELTLTTIYEFDKLLHLLRDRSEHLDLLGIRLTWEEQRCAAWVDLRQLMLDIHNFLAQRATWSPSAYDGLPQTEAPPPVPSVPSRRGSVASMASEHSTSSSSGFSRSARFKLADALSREAAQFAGRISALRHGKAIPDELLDEQDKVEQQGMYDLDNVGKFIMNVVSQWRRSDELYVETIKDQTSAQSLIDDVETALLGHPSSRQDSAFSARASAIIKRLAARETLPRHIDFPSPIPPLFPHQTGANESIVQILLEKSVLEYHAACEAVKAAERSIASADDLSESYDTALTRMLNGVESSNGDGTPPDLTSQSCLRETKHAAFLALLPSCCKNWTGPTGSSIQRLEDIRAESERTRKDLSERVGLLRDVRKIWVSAGDVFSGLGTIRGDIGDVIEQQKWSSNEPLPLINRQALVMAEIRDETHNLEARLEDAEGRYDALAEGFLDRSELTSDATKVQNACQTSMDSLARRSSTASPGLRRRFSSSLDLTLDALQDLPPLGPPIDLTQLDHIVRSDCNSFALRLAAGVSSLQQKMVNLDVVQDARAVDAKLSSVMEAVTHAIEGLETLRTSVSGLPDTFDVIPSLAQTADEETPRFDTRRSEISRSMSPIRQLLQRMDAACDKCPSSRHLLSSRSQALDEVETKFKAWSDDAKALLSDIRQREERLRTAQKEWLERKRLEAEAAERLRREQAEAEARLQAERERAEKERAEMERAEKERIEKERVEREREEQERAERERVERERADRERLERERAEKKRAEKEAREREEAEAAERARREQAEAEERARRERAEAEERERAEREAAQERSRREAEAASVVAFPTSADDDSASDVSDVFGTQGLSEDLAEMQSLIAGLRQRLRSLGINAAASHLPAQLPDHLQSLQSELEASHQLLPRILSLARFGKLVQDCDNALSDLLEHIDSYPAPPSGPLSATTARSMAFDRINGRKSRPASTMSSGRNSRASVDSSQRPTLQKKTSQYSTLSAGPSSRGRGRPSAPAHPSTSSRRVTSHNAEPNQNRSSSRLSVVSSNRSVSGPGPSSSRLFSSTFSSRQRTTSLSSNAGPGPVPSTPSRRSMDPLRPPRHPAASRARRTASPAPSEASVTTRSIGSTSRSTAPSHPTWGRPPKLSFPSSGLLRSPPKIKPPPPKRKPYVANPKSKLDVAVGDVVNKLAVDIRIELCFCRILRSHTVMVRVGGGWMELSKFIQTHFADMFRLLPEPTPQIGSREEKWITSATLLEAPELITTPPRAPKTPEPRGSGGAFPSFVLSTPSGKSPHSIRTHSSPGSPLTALQFLRRVDGEDSFLRPSTPTKGSLLRNQGRASLPLSQAKTPVRNPVWKP